MPHVEHHGWPSASQLKDLLPKPSIDLWQRRVGKEKAEKTLVTSQEFGKRVHDLIEGYLLGGDRIIEEGTFESRLLSSVEKFLIDNELEVVAIEKHETNSLFKFHGTPDLVCRRKDGKLVIVDWKTGGMLDGTSFIQLAIYAYLVSKPTLFEKKEDYKCDMGCFCKIEKDTGEVIPIWMPGLSDWKWLVLGLADTWWKRNGNDATSS